MLIFVSPTPNRELASQLSNIAEQEKEAGVNFKVIETRGTGTEKYGLYLFFFRVLNVAWTLDRLETDTN